MNKTTMEKVQMYFDAALAVTPDKRSDFLAELCGEDTELLKEVQELLDADAQSQNMWDAKAQRKQVAVLKKDDEIGHHRIISQIGVGGMGVVYKALDTRLERYVALKFLPAHYHSDDLARQRFYAEARAASQLDHINICVVHDINETGDGQLYITMPYYDGETLSSRVSRGALPLHEAIDIVLQVGDGLASAHAHNIVHRDIKPANVMLTSDGGVKVLDFGVAKVEDVQLTSTGLSIGTLAYMSPEQLRGEKVDARTDIWALGAVFYEMLAGKRAFPGKALPEILQSVLNLDDDNLQALLAGVQVAVRNIIQTAMAREQQDRYPDVASMLDDLIAARMAMGKNEHSDNQSVYTVQTSAKNATQQRQFKVYDWDEKILDAVAQLLIPKLGPIAPKLVHHAAKKSADPRDLRNRLAKQLPTAADQETFIKQLETEIAEFTTPPMPRAVKNDGSVMGIELSATQLAELEAALIIDIGPIARVLIKQSAAQAVSLKDLSDKLESYLSSQQQIDRFRKDIESVLSGSMQT